MSTPRKPTTDKQRPGRKPLPPEERRGNAGYVRLTARDLERLDAVAPQGRQAFMVTAVLKAIGSAEKRAKA